MGTDIMFAVERRRSDGRWQRAEPLVPNPYQGEFEDESPNFWTLHGEYIHESWSFFPRDRWIDCTNWNHKYSLPEDASRETLEFLTVWTDDVQRMVFLRDLEETDWLAAYSYPWPQDPQERSHYVSSIRQAVRDRLRPLGGPDDVRIVYGLDG